MHLLVQRGSQRAQHHHVVGEERIRADTPTSNAFSARVMHWEANRYWAEDTLIGQFLLQITG